MKVEFENAVCDFCDNDNPELLFKARIVGDDFLDKSFYDIDFPIVRCKKCNLVYLNPRPTRPSMSLFYPPVYYDNDGLEKKAKQRFKRKLQHVLFRAYGSNTLLAKSFKLLIEPHVQIVIEPPKGSQKVLEIGFGAGSLLERLKNIGWDTYGIDTDAAAVEKANKQGHKAILAYFEEYDFKGLKFDLVVMQNVLEHVYSPISVLRKINSILNMGGELVISVPNFGCTQSKIFKENWYGLDAPRHLYQFTPETLMKMFDSCGYRLTRHKKTSFLKKLLSLKVMVSFTRAKLPMIAIIKNILKEYFFYLPLVFLRKRYSQEFDLVFTLHSRKTAEIKDA